MVGVCSLVSCAHAPREEGFVSRESEPIHNLFEVVDGVFSGSEPSTEEAFELLHGLGVELVVSVDGARPELELAARYGMRYVHLPIGYDGMDEGRRRELASVMAQREGAVFVHCHHGVHRGPAAVGAGLVGSGEMGVDDAVAFLERAGTSSRYEGLFESVRGCRVLAGDEMVCSVELPELEIVEGVGALMVQISRTWERVEIVRDGGWRPASSHPDLVPLEEAGMLADGFRLMSEDPSAREYPVGFQSYLASSLELSMLLERALEGGARGRADELAGRIESDCRSCHAGFRD
jgi:hypothetical protein